jgi:hypothetical protein
MMVNNSTNIEKNISHLKQLNTNKTTFVISNFYYLTHTVWRVILAGVKFDDFESKRYSTNIDVFKFGGCKVMQKKIVGGR